MRKLLVASVAMAALIGGANIASAQGAPGAGPEQQRGKATTPAQNPGGAMRARPETNGQAPAARHEEERGGAANERLNERANEGAVKDQHGQQRPALRQGEQRAGSQRETTGQGANEQRQAQPENRGQNERNRVQENRGPNERTGAQPGERGRGPETTGQGARGVGALSTEQRTKIRTTIMHENIRPEQNVNFNVAVGTAIPRTVVLHPLPAEIVTIEPEWRGYEFFLVRDEIIVVDPASFMIVAVLPA